jgi:hypothetical protein
VGGGAMSVFEEWGSWVKRLEKLENDFFKHQEDELSIEHIQLEERIEKLEKENEKNINNIDANRDQINANLEAFNEIFKDIKKLEKRTKKWKKHTIQDYFKMEKVLKFVRDLNKELSDLKERFNLHTDNYHSGTAIKEAIDELKDTVKLNYDVCGRLDLKRKEELNELKEENEKNIACQNALAKEINELKKKFVKLDDFMGIELEKELHELKDVLSSHITSNTKRHIGMLDDINDLKDVLREFFDKHDYKYYLDKLGGDKHWSNYAEPGEIEKILDEEYGGESKEFCPICYGERLGELNDIEDKEKRYHAIQDFINEEIINGGETSEVRYGDNGLESHKTDQTETDSQPPILVRKEDLEWLFKMLDKNDEEWTEHAYEKLTILKERYLKDDDDIL